MKILKTANFNKLSEILDKKIKIRINDDLYKNGLNENKSFFEADGGVSIIWDVLSKYGYGISDIVDKNRFLGDRGDTKLEIEKKNISEDIFNPGEQIENSLIVYSWFKVDERNPQSPFKVHAYLS